MKMRILCTILMLFILTTAGCTKDEIVMDLDTISENTILAKDNGVLQVATVEDFDKAYYNINELQDFVEQEIDTYNTKVGEEKISVEKVHLNDGKAILLLTYTGMDAYAGFNEVSAAYFTGGNNYQLDLPTTLINAKNDSLESTEGVLKNEKYKILVMYEPYNILVEGKVKYYSENASLLENNQVQGAEEGITIVVFKP